MISVVWNIPCLMRQTAWWLSDKHFFSLSAWSHSKKEKCRQSNGNIIGCAGKLKCRGERANYRMDVKYSREVYNWEEENILWSTTFKDSNTNEDEKKMFIGVLFTTFFNKTSAALVLCQQLCQNLCMCTFSHWHTSMLTSISFSQGLPTRFEVLDRKFSFLNLIFTSLI